MSKEKVLTKKDCRQAGKRWLIGISTFNYETQLAPSYAFAVYPLLRKMYPNDEDFKASLNNAMKYYNTMPWISPFVMGAALGIEDEGGIPSLEAVNNFKVGIMGPLAGIGDSFIWGTLRILATGVGTSLALQGSILGPILFLLVFNVPSFILRYVLVYAGYKFGSDFITSAEESGVMDLISKAASILGLTVAGAMAAEMVYLTVPIAIGSGESATTVQAIIDGIIPGLLPLLLTGFVYMLLNKKVKPLVIMFAMMALCIVCAFFGILA